jgi:hypothetical protein
VRAHPNFLLKLAAASALSLAVVEPVQRSAEGSGSEPPVRTLLVTAVLIGLFCVVALLWGMLVDLKLPAKVAVLAVAFRRAVRQADAPSSVREEPNMCGQLRRATRWGRVALCDRRVGARPGPPALRRCDRRLYRAGDERDEQVAIGIGARVGNGLLLTTLGVPLLAENGAAPAERLTFALAFTAVFGASFATLAANPDQVLVATRASG